MKIKEWITNKWINTPEHDLKNKNLKIIGITGTVGKTTTIDLLYQYLMFNEKRVYCISTSGVKCSCNSFYNHDDLQASGFHNQEDLFRHIENAYRENCDYVLVEVTAEMISEGIYDELDFDVLALTYFKTDVVQSFNSNKEYLECKSSIFKNLNTKKIILNSKCGSFVNEIKTVRNDTIYFGTDQDKYYYLGFTVDPNDYIVCEFNTDPEKIYHTKLLSSINRDNLLCVFAVINELGEFDQHKLVFTLDVARIKGRLHKFNLDEREVVIDSGYNGIDGINFFVTEAEPKNTIAVTSVYNFETDEKNQREQVVGFRKAKGVYFNEHFETIIITSSHRGKLDCEEQNINDMASTCPKALKIPNRFEAIKKAWILSKPGDRIFITGKGTEKDINVYGVKMDDENIIKFIHNWMKDFNDFQK